MILWLVVINSERDSRGMMKVIDIRPDANGMINWPTLSAERKSVVTIGAFDGMHRGHREIIGKTVDIAHRNGAFSVVIMFNPRPSTVHNNPDKYDDFGDSESPVPVDDQALSSVRQRLRVMADLGVDHVLVVRYSLAFAAKSYRFFLGQLVGKLGMRALVLGKDAELGAHRSGNIHTIGELARATGVFELVVVDDYGPGDVRVPDPIVRESPQEIGDPSNPSDGMNKAEYRAWSKGMQNKKVRAWSSTNVRWMLATGRVKEAFEILYQPHRVEGTVVHGEERGRELGFPTANLGETIDGYVPSDGVYAGWLIDLDSDAVKGVGASDSEENNSSDVIPTASLLRRDELHLGARSPWRFKAAISIGSKPTFASDSEQKHTVEAYALTDEWKDLYGHRVCLEFAHFLRPQMTFSSLDELKDTLKNDVAKVEELISKEDCETQDSLV